MKTKYQILEQIYESANSLVYRAALKANNQPIILKILKENYPTPSELNRYKQEYEITRSLNADNIIKAYSLERYKNSVVMLLEDFGGQSLKLLLSQNKFSLEDFLTIAIKTIDSLATIHNANIIHKDINPANIVYNSQTEQLKIIDFGISSRLPQEFLTILPPEQLEGTLAYIAPEQTGRMNRGIDYRSDFYSLGVTFYELITNKLPFETTDPIELVHCHIAQQPLPVHELIPEIPLAISNIIDKLLAKAPEDRYQSALGIRADLENCLNQLKSQGQIYPFPLSSQDITDKFNIPQKLYGRKLEVNQLLTAFERVSQGKTEMIFISGYSGIGKSALVNEIHKPITSKRGKFISGKFEQLQRDIPYSAISQAFQDLIRKLLSESETKLQIWKNRILEALGNNGQIIIDVIPNLEKIIGKQPPVKQLGRTESQKRFNLFFKRFVNVFCSKKHPLVIFIDDLQWADLSSLNLIEQLVSDPDNKCFLLIGAYRDNEVSSTHPLIQTLENIKQSEIVVNPIILSPLNIEDINQLIADSLNCSPEVSKPLADLVTQKTGGNPFFLTQLLYSLYQDNLLVFNANQFFNSEDNQQSYWQWDIEQIESVSITDNVVDLMVRKIEKLGDLTQQVLKLAACIGSQFSLEILAVVNNKSQTVTAQELQSALKEGLIVPLDNNYKVPLLGNLKELSNNNPEYVPYKFLHDRVQQAAYSLISEDNKKPIHLEIGRLLLKNVQKKRLENNIFNLVNHFNEGLELITEQSEKDQLAKLNLQASKKAKGSTAYETALDYLDIGAKLLNSNDWNSQNSLIFEINLELLEVLHLTANFLKVQDLADVLLNKNYDTLGKVKIYQTLLLSNFAEFKEQKAIESAIKALALPKIDLNVPQDNNEINKRTNQEYNRLKLLLKDKQIKDLIDLPQLTDPYKTAAIVILQQMMYSLVRKNSPLVNWSILVQINLCIQHGNLPQAAISYGHFTLFQSDSTSDLDLAYQFGQLSLKLREKYNLPSLNAPVIMYYGFRWHWKEYLRNIEVQKKCLNSFQKGRDGGYYFFAGFCFINYNFIKLFGGYNLEDIQKDGEKYLKVINKFPIKYCVNYINVCHRITNKLINHHQDYIFFGNSFSAEEKSIDSWTKNDNTWLLFITYFAKAFCLYIFKQHNQALKYSIESQKCVDTCAKYLPAPQVNFYSSLTYLANYHDSNLVQQKQLLDRVNNNQRNLKIWTGYCLENFQHKYDLVEAEKARVLGHSWQAAELYEKAIQGAKQYEFIHEEALAYERAAEFYLALDRKEIGQLYLKNAHHCYSRWGAKAKVKQLEAEYPEYLLRVTNQGKSSNLSTNISTSGTNGEILDIATILKASQAISGEIKLEKLLQNLMTITIENAGAQTGFLILNHQGNLVIEAQGTVEQGQVTVLQSIPIDYINPETSIPTLPTTVINYVARTQENLVLNNAFGEGQFIDDPYISATQSKSVLCTPLLNRGRLRGVVYLENNLATGAFTAERVELLNILSAQAAISIDNSRLYQTLEQRVEERTRELSQTLDVLKATQQELIFENDLLKNTEQSESFNYQVGGSLAMDSPTYVVRSADRNLYQALRQGEFCYILNARQMGKSSLMVRMMNHLNQEGFSCGAIDMTRIGSEDVTPEQWYKGIAIELWRSFDLFRKVNLKTWWNERKDLAPVQRLSQFIEEILLVSFESKDNSSLDKIVIFIDEIDCVLGLDFPVDDFFALIRSCYNQRTLDSKYQRLTVALFGVATPSELISDRQKTPFNIGQAIQLEGFKEHEAQPLLYGFTDKINNPQVVLKEVLNWTGGQPFLTQKLCKLILNSSTPIPTNQEAEWIANLVQTKMIDDWEFQDEPEHFKTIRDRILKSEYQPQLLLELYQQILNHDTIESRGSVVESELLLSGLVIKKQKTLKVHNRIYKFIFDSTWIKNSHKLIIDN
ncbi:MAG: AAA family ATPase [Cyanobacteria bacterium P01_A01_bin.83]